MRRTFRRIVVVVVVLTFAGSALAVPREGREQRRGRDSGIVKVVKKIVRALGDGLTVPLP